jgi:hypothetical protein
MTHAIPILMYHSIDRHGDPRAPRWTLSPTLFAEHMHWLAVHDYRPLTISDLVSAVHRGNPCRRAHWQSPSMTDCETS